MERQNGILSSSGCRSPKVPMYAAKSVRLVLHIYRRATAAERLKEGGDNKDCEEEI